MSIQKIFVYFDFVNNEEIFLHGPDNADPKKLLEMYVDWYNNDFLITEVRSLDKKDIRNFNYCYSRCPIDFYDDYISCGSTDK